MLFPSRPRSLGWHGIASSHFNGRAVQPRSASNITSYPKMETQPCDDQNSSTSQTPYSGCSEATGLPLTNAMKTRPDGLFLLFFRVMYLTIFTGFTCFTILGFAAIGTGIGVAATVVVAVGSEIAFVLAKNEEAEMLRQERYTV